MVAGIPKTVLHLHIEGSLEPELAFVLAERNSMAPGSQGFPYESLDQLRAAYRFADLGAFLDVYYAVAGVLRTEDDFHALAEAYGRRLQAEGVRWAEVFFDPQTHTSRGIPFDTVVRGLQRGFASAHAAGIHVALVLCFLRDAPVGEPAELQAASSADGFASMDQATAWATLGQLLQHRATDGAKVPNVPIIGIGLDSYEKPYPPELFTDVFEHARARGLAATAHAGEEGPPQFVWTSIRELKVSRIDHGVRSTEDPELMAFLAQEHDTPEIVAAYGRPHRIPLTVCPRSNYMLKVFPDPTRSNLLELLDAGVLACIHSDDPAYFGGYASDNYLAVIDWLDPSWAQLRQLARNGVLAAWGTDAAKQPLLDDVDAWFSRWMP
ncbi:adenosine deaminase family protein [Paraliomyxa miuraensis]|uniref:adenosine deaminase family protein n=1 Tax=Paraliomyxa miuraensis TaxID=376150 RepID=UPI00225434C7|nr:adenosine deaminase family protein [Paraliomyxa miuraensis]MCX4242053.1 adenosine deaminase family protein [Paraliomyxa miuraensis]